MVIYPVDSTAIQGAGNYNQSMSHGDTTHCNIALFNKQQLSKLPVGLITQKSINLL